ncbi:MAG TPA: DUF11 domain-containing protein [Actinomycetota bacterium]|nr:DUF11 domain-containing protein [Actinomycetota bacterium]
MRRSRHAPRTHALLLATAFVALGHVPAGAGSLSTTHGDLRGVVSHPRWGPIAGIRVSVTSNHAEPIQTSTCTYLNGSYLLTLPAGSYTVRFDDDDASCPQPPGLFRTQWWQAAETEEAATRLEIVAGQQHTADASLQLADESTPFISGVLSGPPGQSPHSVRVEAFDADDAADASPVASTCTPSEGPAYFRLMVPASADYVVRFAGHDTDPCPGGLPVFISEWYDDSSTRTGARTIAGTSLPFGPLEATLSPGRQITGTVEDQQRRDGIDGACVDIFSIRPPDRPQDIFDWRSPHDPIVTVRTAANGAYASPVMARGDEYAVRFRGPDGCGGTGAYVDDWYGAGIGTPYRTVDVSLSQGWKSTGISGSLYPCPEADCSAVKDLRIEAIVENGPVFTPMTYRVRVENRGPGTETGVTLTTLLDERLQFSAASAPGGCERSGRTVVCALGSLERWETANARITVIPNEARTYLTQATASGDGFDPFPADNQRLFSDAVIASRNADTSLSASGSADPVTVNGWFRYDFRISNAGPAAAEGVLAVANLAPGLRIGPEALPEGAPTYTASQGVCDLDPTRNRIVCQLGKLERNGSALVSIPVRAPGTPGNLESGFTVRSSNLDPEPGNNQAVGQTLVVPVVASQPTLTGASRDPATGELTAVASKTDPQPIAISALVACPNGSAPTSVTLTIGSLTTPMTPEGEGRYGATVTAEDLQAGAVGDVIITAACAGGNVANQVGTIVLYDPSGIVTDAVTDQPVNGATVTLHKVADWTPWSEGEEQPAKTCQTVGTRPGGAEGSWTQTAPTYAGEVVDPASPEIDPAENPQITGAGGRLPGQYAWDVAEGCWYVVVEKTGYLTLTSPVVGVPPAVTDLHLELTPVPGFRTTTLSSSFADRTYEEPVTLSGAVSSATDGCAAASVRIWRDVLGDQVDFQVYRETTAGPSGAFSVPVTPDASATYRAEAVAEGACLAAESATQTVRVAAKVGLKASSTRVSKGTTVKLTATVAPCPGHPGHAVTLVRGTKQIGEKQLGSTCKAVFKVKMLKTRTFEARYEQQHDDHDAGISKRVTVRV